MPDAGIEGPGAAETAAALAGGRSGVGDSAACGLLAAPGATGFVWGAAFAGAATENGGGCGGRPAATRWRTAGVASRSGLVEVTDRGSPVPATLGGGTSTRAGPGLEVAGAACGRARSRPLPPGGVSSEFTAYAPTSTPPWPLPPAFNSGSDQFRYRPHAPAGICTLDLCRSAIGPSAHSTTEPAHIMREYGQR